MATLINSVERLPAIYQRRYNPVDWITWANALLERLSSEGVLPSQPLTRGVPVHSERWVNRPPNCRDVIHLTDNEAQTARYRFVEENGRLRLLDERFPKGSAVTYVSDVGGVEQHGIWFNNEGYQFAENQFNGHLFMIDGGTAKGHGFIVDKSYPVQGMNPIYVLEFFDAPDLNVEVGDNSAWSNVQERFHPPSVGGAITSGHFVDKRNYLIMAYTARFDPIVSMAGEFVAGDYDGLAAAWFRWKIEEEVNTISQECKYWYGQMEEELRRLRAEKSNRLNRPQGRFLAGFR